MPSSVIRTFLYDANEKRLLVIFTTGRKYVYDNVPQETHDAFRNASSKGRYFNDKIRDKFPCREITSAA